MKNSYRYKGIDFVGHRSGRLTVIRKSDVGRSQWVCRCDCGKEVTLLTSRLLEYKSCGCLEKENREKLSTYTRTHGMTETRLYRTWCKMKDRCNNPNIEHYPEYGGRGIKVCDEWKNSFENFRDWAYSVGYDEKLSGKEQSIDRIDVNGNYEPSNCRWVTHKEQTRNKTNTIYMHYKGGKVPISAFCEENGITYEHFVIRNLERGLKAEEMLRIWKFRQGEHEGYYSLSEAAEHYGVSAQSVKKWIDKGILRGEKVGFSWYVPCGQEVERRTDRNELGQFLPSTK